MDSIVSDDDVVVELIEHGAKIDQVDKFGRNALIFAVENGYKNLVIELIIYGANINQRDKFKRTAFDIAKENGFKDIIHILKLAKDYKDKQFNIFKRKIDKEDISEELQEYFGKYLCLADICDRDGRTLMHYACLSGL